MQQKTYTQNVHIVEQALMGNLSAQEGLNALQEVDNKAKELANELIRINFILATQFPEAYQGTAK